MSSVKTNQKNSPRPTNKQVGHVNDYHSDVLFGFSKPEVDAIIGNGGLYKDAFRKMVRDFVSRFTNFVTMVAAVVNREQPQQEMLAALGRKQYVNADVVAIIPRQAPAGVADNEPMMFFKLDLSKRNDWVSDDDLEKEFEARGVVADPCYQLNVNRENPEFADEHPNACHWKDANGKWCFATFFQGVGGRCVRVSRGGVGGWRDAWWFAGRRKS